MRAYSPTIKRAVNNPTSSQLGRKTVKLLLEEEEGEEGEEVLSAFSIGLEVSAAVSCIFLLQKSDIFKILV